MRASYKCPVCDADRWESIDKYRYDRPGTTNGIEWSEYEALRMRVLFEVWLPGEEHVTLTSQMCRGCGFVAYSPRPTPDDIDAKYRLLQKEERHIGANGGGVNQAAMDRLRAQRVYQEVIPHVPPRPLDVLDFGGGNGKLLLPFIDAGHNCFLVDYNVEPLPRVTKIGDTLNDIPADQKFDVIICSHVIEHLADPGEHVKRFKDHLKEDGVIYGEVPLGVWNGIGIERDPVTHVNFFTEHSFGRLFEHRDMNVLVRTRMVGTYIRRIDVIVVVARNEPATARNETNGAVKVTRALLNPTPLMKVRKMLRLRRYPSPRGIVRHIGRLAGIRGR
jgi:SAM-dependent methyltransferase